MNLVRTLFVLLLCVALTACGGGGGGGGGSKKSSNGGAGNTGGGDTGTNPPFEIDEVALFTVGMGTAEVTLTLARLSADAFLSLEADVFAGRTDNCTDAGERTLTFTDVDASTDLSVGDQVELTFDNCSGSAVAGVVNGTIRLALNSITSPAGPLARTLVFSETLTDFMLGDGGGQQTIIEGGFQLQFDDNESSGATLTVVVNSGSLQYIFPGGDSVSVEPGSQLQKTLDLDSDIYHFSFDQTLNVSLSGETFTLYADTFGADVAVAGSFTGNLTGAPTEGAARFYVPDVGSQCLLTVGSDSSNQAEPLQPLVRLLEVGDACMTAGTDILVPWQNMVAGALFGDIDSFDLRP